MTPDVKIEPTTPLSSEELENDAREEGVEADEVTRRDGETRLPASESDHVGEAAEDEADRGGDLDKLPPD